MIPISDDNPARRPALVTWTVMALCTAVWLWEYSLGRAMNPLIAR